MSVYGDISDSSPVIARVGERYIAWNAGSFQGDADLARSAEATHGFSTSIPLMLSSGEEESILIDISTAHGAVAALWEASTGNSITFLRIPASLADRFDFDPIEVERDLLAGRLDPLEVARLLLSTQA